MIVYKDQKLVYINEEFKKHNFDKLEPIFDTEYHFSDKKLVTVYDLLEFYATQLNITSYFFKLGQDSFQFLLTLDSEGKVCIELFNIS